MLQLLSFTEWFDCWCMCFMSFILFRGMLRCSSAWIGCLWIVPLTTIVIVMKGLTFHHVALSVCMSGLY